MHPRPVHDADYRATMTSTSPHPNPGGLCRKCADCPALCNGTELQLKLIALREAAATIIDSYHAATTDHATSHRRAPEQKRRCRPRHKPTYC